MKKLLFGPRMWVILILTLLVFGALFFLQWFGQQKMNEFFDNMPPPEVTVSSAEAQVAEWTPTIRVAGSLVAVDGAQLTTETGGIVDEIHHPNGGEVEAGDAVISLVADTDRAELDALKATATLAEIELQRARSLFDRNTLSRSELDRRQSELDQAQANVAAQEARVAQKVLRAPFAGRLGIRRVNVGQYVAAGDPIISLQGLDPLYVNFTLPEQYSRQVQPGLDVQVHVGSVRPDPVIGQITAIEPEVDEITRNFAVQATIRNPDGQLRAGMFAEVEVPLGVSEAVTVLPQTAITHRSFGSFVYVLTPVDSSPEKIYQVSQRFVTLGSALGDLVAVSNVDPGETVANSGLLKLQAGSIVRINNTVVPDAERHPSPPSG